MSTTRRAKELSSVARVNITGTSVKYSDQLKLLGVTLDAAFTFDAQIKSVSKASFFHIQALRHIRPTLTEDLANTVAGSLVQSRLDYANSLYSGMSSSNFVKLQRIQNTLARVVTLSDKRVHITPCSCGYTGCRFVNVLSTRSHCFRTKFSRPASWHISVHYLLSTYQPVTLDRLKEATWKFHGLSSLWHRGLSALLLPARGIHYRRM